MLSMRAFLRGHRAPAVFDGGDGEPSFRPLPASHRHSPDTATGILSWPKIAVLLSASAFLAGIGIGSVATFVAMLHFTPSSVGLPHSRVSGSSQPDGAGVPRAGVVAPASSEARSAPRQWLSI